MIWTLLLSFVSSCSFLSPLSVSLVFPKFSSTDFTYANVTCEQRTHGLYSWLIGCVTRNTAQSLRVIHTLTSWKLKCNIKHIRGCSRHKKWGGAWWIYIGLGRLYKAFNIGSISPWNGDALKLIDTRGTFTCSSLENRPYQAAEWIAS